jgi:hypothetical protein
MAHRWKRTGGDLHFSRGSDSLKNACAVGAFFKESDPLALLDSLRSLAMTTRPRDAPRLDNLDARAIFGIE